MELGIIKAKIFYLLTSFCYTDSLIFVYFQPGAYAMHGIPSAADDRGSGEGSSRSHRRSGTPPKGKIDKKLYIFSENQSGKWKKRLYN